MKKTTLSYLMFFLTLAVPCYAVDSQGNYEIVEGTVNTTLVKSQLAQIKRTFLLNKNTGESYIFADGKWYLMEKVNKAITEDEEMHDNRKAGQKNDGDNEEE